MRQRGRLATLGLLVTAVGLVGLWWSEQWIRNNPGVVLGDALFGFFGAQPELPLSARAALFFQDAGFVIGGAGLALTAIAFVLGRRS